MFKARSILAAGVLVVVMSMRAGAQGAVPLHNKERVTFPSGNLVLVGFVYHPSGTGPFPTVIWNHGSERGPGEGAQFDSVAAMFVPAGFAVFAPTRRGHGRSEGTYIVDTLNKLREKGDLDGANKLMVKLLETEQLDDQLAGVAYARRLSYVDTTRMVVAGCSFGGIQTLLAAEKRGVFKAAFPISPAAQTWDGNAAIRERLIRAVKTIDVPVFLVQPPRDPSLEPARVLGDTARGAGKNNFKVKVYGPVMPDNQQTHCFGGTHGFRNWASDAVMFFNGVLGRSVAR